ncbi:MAG: type II toxin-antitoxin system VapC family toxin [Opitutales bacterium]|nr:type II toxin-antitoxin system VapC family toxin [Opitutales bacterium]
MNSTVFIETTIPSYYVGKRSRDIVQAARQELTIEWWDKHRSRYELLSSQIVLDEAARGDPAAARKRLDLLAEIPLLVITAGVVRIAEELLKDDVVPERAADDAFHIACAGVHGVDFLLTWNCKHIANPHNQPRIRGCFARHGIRMPVICTPEEFIGDDYEHAY